MSQPEPIPVPAVAPYVTAVPALPGETPNTSLKLPGVPHDSDAPRHLKLVSREQVAAVEYARLREEGQAPDIGYSARIWAQVSLPYSDPGPIPYWVRGNGAVSLTMRPALLDRDDGTKYEAYAYGLLPRKMLMWISSEAVRTQSPVLQLGRSMSAFMAKLGIAHGGRDAKRTTDQLRRLLGSQLSVTGLGKAADGTFGEKHRYIQIASAVDLWFSKDGALSEENEGLWASEIRLTEEFFKSIIDAPVPVDLRAVKALGQAPLSHDLYVWSTHRMYSLDRPMNISWLNMMHQLGSDYKKTYHFKPNFMNALARVKTIYPELNITMNESGKGLDLLPSPTHIQQTKPRKELI